MIPLAKEIKKLGSDLYKLEKEHDKKFKEFQDNSEKRSIEVFRVRDKINAIEEGKRDEHGMRMKLTPEEEESVKTTRIIASLLTSNC